MSALMNATKKFIGLSGSLKNFLNKREFARTLWIMSKSPEVASTNLHSIGCNCGCGAKQMHSKGKLLDLIHKICDEIT